MAQATLSPTYNEANEPKKDEDEELYKEFTSEQDMKDEDKFALVTKLDRMFRYALDHTTWVKGRERMVKCFKYREGEQWTPEEIKALEARHQPDTVNNQIAVVVNKLVGDVVNQRVRIGYRGRNAKLDEQEAKLLSDIFLHIRQSNDLEFEERDMADDGFTCGMGVLDVDVEFDDLAQPHIKVRHEDPLTTLPDPDSRTYDWNEDAKFVITAKWWKVEDAAEMYPQAELALKGALSAAVATGDDVGGSGQLGTVDAFKGEKYVDKDNERIRVIRVQYKKKEREQLAIFGDGTSQKFTEKKEITAKLKAAKEAGMKVRIIDRLTSRICVGVYASGILLEHKETDHAFFSLVPYFAYRRKTGEPYSLISLALSMQDAINKRESKALALLTMNQVIAEKSAVDNRDDVQTEVAKPDGYIEVRDGALTNQKFQIEKNLELAQSQFAMHQHAQEDLFKIMGIDPKMGQSTGEIRSGTGLQRKYSEGAKPVATLFDNIRRTRKILARVLLDRVQKYYTPYTTFLITEDKESSREVGITADQMESIRQGSYDVVVDELEDSETAQQEQAQALMQILPQIIPLGPYWVQVLLKLSNLREKDQYINDLKQLSGPPPIAPKVNLQANLDALEPVERAGVWALMGRDDIAQAVQQANPPSVNQIQARTELAKAEIAQQPDGGDQAKQEGEHQKIALEMHAKQQEHGLKLQEMQAKHQTEMASLQMKQQAAEGKHELDVRKHQMALQKMVVGAATKQETGKSNAQES